MATGTRRTAGKKKDDNSPGISISLNGKTYTVRQSDISAHDARALRQETGFSWAGLLREAEKDFDIDLLAALIWFARRIDGDTVTYSDVLDEVDYDSDLAITVDDKRTIEGAKVEDGEAPEA